MRNIVLLLLISTNTYCQLKLFDLNRFSIGNDLLDSRKEIEKLFPTKGNLYKSETFSSVYRYQFENITFNYCDNATYEFLYVNDKLSNLAINMRYVYNKESSEAAKYLKSIETLLNDFKEIDSLFEILPEFSNIINLNKIDAKIDSLNYYYNTQPKQYSGDGVEVKYSGVNVYKLKKSGNDPKILFLYTSILKEVNQDKTTRTISFLINLQLTSIKHQEYYQKYSWGTNKYIEEKSEINLTFENGVYKLPVNLNEIMM